MQVFQPGEQEPAIYVFVWLKSFRSCQPQTSANAVCIFNLSTDAVAPSTIGATFRHEEMLTVCPLKCKLAAKFPSLGQMEYILTFKSFKRAGGWLPAPPQAFLGNSLQSMDSFIFPNFQFEVWLSSL